MPLIGAQHSPHDMQQIVHGVGRPSEQTDARLYYNFPDKQIRRIDLDKYEQHLKEAAQIRIQFYKPRFGEKPDEVSREMIEILEESDYGGHRTPDHMRLVTPTLKVNTLQIRHQIHQKSIQNAYASPDSMREALKDYGIDLVQGVSHERIVEAPKVKSVIDISSFDREVEEYFSGGIVYSSEVGERCRFLLKYFERDHAKDLMFKNGRRKGTWSSLRKMVLAQRPFTREEELVRDAMYASFSEGELLTSAEIHGRVIAVMKDDPMVTNESMTKAMAAQTLNRYFKTKQVNRRVPAAVRGEGTPEFEKVRRIESISPLPYPVKAETPNTEEG